MEDSNNRTDAPGRSWAHVVKRGRVENIIDHHEQYDDHNRPQADHDYPTDTSYQYNDHDTAPFDVAAFLSYLDLNAPAIDIYDD